jgi:hypothetical protein
MSFVVNSFDIQESDRDPNDNGRRTVINSFDSQEPDDDPNGDGLHTQGDDFSQPKQIFMRVTIEYRNREQSLNIRHDGNWLQIAEFAQDIIANELPDHMAIKYGSRINTKIQRICQGTIVIEFSVGFLLYAGLEGLIKIILHYKDFRDGIDQLIKDVEIILKRSLETEFGTKFDVKAEVIGKNKTSLETKLNCLLILNIVLLIYFSVLVYIELSRMGSVFSFL